VNKQVALAAVLVSVVVGFCFLSSTMKDGNVSVSPVAADGGVDGPNEPGTLRSEVVPDRVRLSAASDLASDSRAKDDAGEQLSTPTTPRRTALNAGEPSSLEEKYAGLSSDKLVVAYNDAVKRRLQLGNELLKQRWRNGGYEERFVADGARSPEFRGRPDGSPITVGFQMEPTGGGSLVRTVDLSSADPAYRQIELEADWLHKRLHALSACACAAPTSASAK